MPASGQPGSVVVAGADGKQAHTWRAGDVTHYVRLTRPGSVLLAQARGVLGAVEQAVIATQRASGSAAAETDRGPRGPTAVAAVS